MVNVDANPSLVQLARLDVLDVGTDGGLVLNAAFLRECRAAFAADSSIIDTVIGAHILKRALAGKLVVDLDLRALTLAVLELGSADIGAR